MFHLGEAEQSKIDGMFKSSLSSKIYSDDFVRAGWFGRLIFTDVYQFWEKRGVVFLGPDDVFVDDDARTTSQIRSRIKELESQLL
jgi:hypothetical protein